MRQIPVEICVHSCGDEAVREAVRAACEGGAATVELCAGMNVGGITPPEEHIEIARGAFRKRPGLMVMIRPRGGNFCYSDREIQEMLAQIRTARQAGADGVVLGVLRRDGGVDMPAMRILVGAAGECDLRTTFHRAFDAASDPRKALEQILELGMDRVLTSGIPWGREGIALDGLACLAETIRQAGRRIQVVVGGGIGPENVAEILRQLPLGEGDVAVHAYSGAQVGGVTSAEAVRALVRAANLV